MILDDYKRLSTSRQPVKASLRLASLDLDGPAWPMLGGKQLGGKKVYPAKVYIVKWRARILTFEEFLITEAVGLMFHGFDFVVGAFQAAGGDRVIVVGQNVPAT